MRSIFQMSRGQFVEQMKLNTRKANRVKPAAGTQFVKCNMLIIFVLREWLVIKNEIKVDSNEKIWTIVLYILFIVDFVNLCEYIAY